jgi:hypothetical protein
MSPTTGLDAVDRRKALILPGQELLPLGRPACSQSLYDVSGAESVNFIRCKKLS